ncbi:hypothetical protein F7725_009066 [Dissostichus mawsoni]|uniref:Uncharacterized protein n=1 Tax=Dissostichus mawsoni TaxID=36200 RepID=A0A7J5Z929_DISMA|nr:hypothetical protein F7725_009066 [Dissostichus mawsoni]
MFTLVFVSQECEQEFSSCRPGPELRGRGEGFDQRTASTAAPRLMRKPGSGDCASCRCVRQSHLSPHRANPTSPYYKC